MCTPRSRVGRTPTITGDFTRRREEVASDVGQGEGDRQGEEGEAREGAPAPALSRTEKPAKPTLEDLDAELAGYQAERKTDEETAEA
eukprot:2446286-Prymnesium_polylepis.1